MTNSARVLASKSPARSTVIAQDPETAFVPVMPRSAIATGAVHEVLALEAIAPRVVELVQARRRALGGPANDHRRIS